MNTNTNINTNINTIDVFIVFPHNEYIEREFNLLKRCINSVLSCSKNLYCYIGFYTEFYDNHKDKVDEIKSIISENNREYYILNMTSNNFKHELDMYNYLVRYSKSDRIMLMLYCDMLLSLPDLPNNVKGYNYVLPDMKDQDKLDINFDFTKHNPLKENELSGYIIDRVTFKKFHSTTLNYTNLQFTMGYDLNLMDFMDKYNTVLPNEPFVFKCLYERDNINNFIDVCKNTCIDIVKDIVKDNASKNNNLKEACLLHINRLNNEIEKVENVKVQHFMSRNEKVIKDLKQLYTNNAYILLSLLNYVSEMNDNNNIKKILENNTMTDICNLIIDNIDKFKH